MKENYINLVFVIDESGSMSGTESDVIGGFKKVVDEQKEIKEGTCTVSYFKFASNVEEVFVGKDVNQVEYLDGKYNPAGMTALFDGVGTAIDKIGKWLNSMKESEKPEKTMVVIMTDGGENYSKDYSASKVKEMIKHQEDKYNWTFVYMGSDLTDAKDANSLGFTSRSYSSKDDYFKNYEVINDTVKLYRTTLGSVETKMAVANDFLCTSLNALTEEYAAETGIDANSLKADNS
jgi:uncharacterized protein YegL